MFKFFMPILVILFSLGAKEFDVQLEQDQNFVTFKLQTTEDCPDLSALSVKKLVMKQEPEVFSLEIEPDKKQMSAQVIGKRQVEFSFQKYGLFIQENSYPVFINNEYYGKLIVSENMEISLENELE